ncbi:MAG: hypothetical protein JWQ87_2919 [Candidatus Sulfotelmatobacter sp.]|nr:hypothetical protein [Candidatus Sulfotelmatobacter sp.]
MRVQEVLQARQVLQRPALWARRPVSRDRKTREVTLAFLPETWDLIEPSRMR